MPKGVSCWLITIFAWGTEAIVAAGMFGLCFITALGMLGVTWGVCCLETELCAAGKAEKGDEGSFVGLLIWRFRGGLPRVLPEPPGAPLLHAEDTTFAPCRRLDFGLPGMLADLGSSNGSGHKTCPVEGVMAE